MAKKIIRVRIRAERVERPFLSNQWRSMPKISVRKTEKTSGPRIGDAALYPGEEYDCCSKGDQDTGQPGIATRWDSWKWDS